MLYARLDLYICIFCKNRRNSVHQKNTRDVEVYITEGKNLQYRKRMSSSLSSN